MGSKSANMSTKDDILNIANELILSRGYNAFSFADISEQLGIKKASIHYHFTSKTDLGKEVIQKHINEAHRIFDANRHTDPIDRLNAFFHIYERRKQANQVCLIGSLATDLQTIDSSLQEELKVLAQLILDELTEVLLAGKSKNRFRFEENARTKALMIITNISAALQVSRLTMDEDFDLIKTTILQNITT